jgi:hypothetical protein
MAKYPKYKYRFRLGEEEFLLAVGESVTAEDGDIVKIHKFQAMSEKNLLWFSRNGGNWSWLKTGEFTRYRVTYPTAYPKGMLIKMY